MHDDFRGVCQVWDVNILVMFRFLHLMSNVDEFLLSSFHPYIFSPPVMQLMMYKMYKANLF